MNNLFMSQDFYFYLFAIAVVVVVFLVIKKIASCLIKSIVMLVIVAALAYIWFMYFRT